MKKSKNKVSAMTLRRIFQLFFLAFSIFYYFKFSPTNKTLLMPILVIILITIVFRAGFCGWICPLGTFFDLLRKLTKTIGSITFIKPINRKYKKWINNNRNRLNIIDKYAKFFKYIFLLWMLRAAYVLEGNQHENVNFPLIFAIVFIAVLFIDRAWCRYSCPLGAVLGMVSKLSPTKVARCEDRCIDCNKCTRICSLNIDVATRKSVTDKDCNACLDCIDVCPVNGALGLKTSLPWISRSQSDTNKTQSLGLTIKTIEISKYIYGFIVVFLLVAGLFILKLN